MTLGTSPCLNFPNCKMGILRVTSGLLQGLKDATGILCPGTAQDIKCLTDLQGLVEYSRKNRPAQKDNGVPFGKHKVSNL